MNEGSFQIRCEETLLIINNPVLDLTSQEVSLMLNMYTGTSIIMHVFIHIIMMSSHCETNIFKGF